MKMDRFSLWEGIHPCDGKKFLIKVGNKLYESELVSYRINMTEPNMNENEEFDYSDVKVNVTAILKVAFGYIAVDAQEHPAYWNTDDYRELNKICKGDRMTFVDLFETLGYQVCKYPLIAVKLFHQEEDNFIGYSYISCSDLELVNEGNGWVISDECGYSAKGGWYADYDSCFEAHKRKQVEVVRMN